MHSSGFKSLGDQGWVGYWSNIFWDRDVRPDAPRGERFTLPAIKEYADWANSDPANMPDLWFWHLPNVGLGQAKTVDVVGPFIFATGEWGTGDRAKQFRHAIEQNTDIEWGMSHGFQFDAEDRVNGEYHKFRTYEVSVLPIEAAANPVTMFLEAKHMNVKDIIASLVKIGIPEDEAADIVKDAEKETNAMQADGKSHGQKEGEEATEQTTDTDADSGAADDGEGDTEAVERDEMAELAADLLLRLVEQGEEAKALRAEVDALKTTQLESAKALTELVDVIKAMQDQQEAEKALLPRAVQQALLAKVGEKVSPDDVKQDMKAQHTELSKETGGKVDFDADNPWGWFGAQTGIPGLS